MAYSIAYWYHTRTNELIRVPDGWMHAEYVIKNQEKFGGLPDHILRIVEDDIENGGDGSAADVEIYRFMVVRGWVRVHRYSNTIAFTVYQLDKRNREAVFDMVSKFCSKESNEKVVIEPIISSVGDIRNTYASEVLTGELFERSLPNMQRKNVSSVIWFNSKTGKIISSPSDHVFLLLNSPETFGLTKQQVDKWGEGVNIEKIVIKNGWYRVHTYPAFMTVDLDRYDKKAKENIYDLVVELGVNPNSKITIRDIRDNYYIDLPAEEFTSGEIFESKKFLRLISEANIKTDKFSGWVPEAKKALDFWLKRYKDEDQSSNFFGRYEVFLRDVREGFSDTAFSFTLRPKHGSKNVSIDGMFRKSQSFAYRTPAKAVEEVPPTVPGYAYRGMSFEEWDVIKKTGVIKSRGGYNIGNKQVGLTFFGNKSDTASIYANGFAPISYKTSRNRPGVVIEVPDEHLIKGGSEEMFNKYMISSDELVGEGELPASVINRAWMVVPVLAREGSLDVIKNNYNGKFSEGSWDHPSFKVVYVPIEDLP